MMFITGKEAAAKLLADWKQDPLDGTRPLLDRARPALLSLNDADVRSPVWAKGQHALTLHVDDITFPRAGFSAVMPYHLQRIVDWARGNAERDWLIHCAQGVSRSPAAALVACTALALGKPGDATVAAREAVQTVVAALAETEAQGHRYGPARPNARFLLLGDELLDCGGQLVAAALEQWPTILPFLERARGHLDT